MAQNNEELGDACIHINEASPAADSKPSEITVHYDLRFLKEKSKETQVVRLSPMRFRRKE